MNWTLEVVVVPVSDVDTAKAFYADQLGFAVDHDTKVGDDLRIVQLTPPGSGCSVVISKGHDRHGAGLAPGPAAGRQRRARPPTSQLEERGVKTGGIVFMSPGGQRPAEDGDDLNNSGFVHFADPDGNAWAVQQITNRP